MSRQRVGFSSKIRGAVTVATVFAMVFGIVAPALADTATFSGAVMAPDNSFAEGFTVVFKDVVSGQEFRSGPTSATGEYQVSVPTGGRYKLDSVLAPDGTKLPVQNVPPIPVRVAGTSKLDVKFANAALPPAPPPTTAVAAAPPAARPTPQPVVASTRPPREAEEKREKRNKGGTPWWKRPGPIVGMVLGGAVIVALAVGSGGGSNNVASQSTP